MLKCNYIFPVGTENYYFAPPPKWHNWKLGNICGQMFYIYIVLSIVLKLTALKPDTDLPKHALTHIIFQHVCN